MKAVAHFVALVALFAAANSQSGDGGKCLQNADCGEGFYCECSERFFPMPGESSTDLVCKPKHAIGEWCGGFVMCPTYCAEDLVCQEHAEPEYGPRIADRPGVCCPPMKVSCADNELPTYDANGCLNGGCRPKVCNGMQPAMDDNGIAPLFCGRGPAHVDCPAGTECVIAPDDTYALCCPSEPVVVGGPEPVDVSSAEIRAAADCGLAAVNRDSGALKPTVAVRVTGGTQQVVAGILYVLSVEVGETDVCINDGAIHTRDDCPVLGATRTATLTVTVQPWLDAADLNRCAVVKYEDTPPAPICPDVMCMMYCENGFIKDANGCDTCKCSEVPTASVPAPVPGGVVPLDVSDERALGAGACAVAAINKQSNALYRQMFARIISGTQQVVAGMRYVMRIQAGESSSCRNDGTEKTLDECPITTPVSYDVDVLVQPWGETPCTLTSFKAVPVCNSLLTCRMLCLSGYAKDENGCDMCKCAEPSTTTVSTTTATPTTSSTSATVSIKPVPCKMVMCMMFCENGFAKDANGCPLCQCSTKPASSTATPTTVPSTTASSTSSSTSAEDVPRVGGKTPVDVTDSIVALAASCAVHKITGNTDLTNAMVLLEVVSGTKQVVAGIKFHLRIRVGQSSACANDGKLHTIEDCPVADTDFRGEYDVNVVLQQWLEAGSCVSSDYSLVSSDGTIVAFSKSDADPAASSSTPAVIGVCVGAAVMLLAIVAVIVVRKRTRTHRVIISDADAEFPVGYENPTYQGTPSPSILEDARD